MLPTSKHTLLCLCPQCLKEAERTRLQAYLKGVSQGRKEAFITSTIIALAWLLLQALTHILHA